MAAAVLLPAGLVALHAEGLLLAEADGAEAVGGNAQRNHELLDGGGAAIAEAQVVFRGATLVGLACNVTVGRAGAGAGAGGWGGSAFGGCLQPKAKTTTADAAIKPVR